MSDVPLYEQALQAERRGPRPLKVHPESGPLRAVHLSRHKWPGGLVNRGHLLSSHTPHPTPHPYTLNPEPITRNPKSHTLHPNPYTLNRKRNTQNPKPYILHLNPYTPNPRPITRNPKPHTLHPNPYTLHHKSNTRNPKPRKPKHLIPNPNRRRSSLLLYYSQA